MRAGRRPDLTAAAPAGERDAAGGAVRLKPTLPNPQASKTDIDELPAAVDAAGQAVEAAS